MSDDKVYFRNLDSIRFIAALMVFNQHALNPWYVCLGIRHSKLERILLMLGNGGLGVSIFFVLSGFLITYLLISEYKKNAKISVPNFYMRRVLRIWPVYYLVILTTFVFYPFVSSFFRVNIDVTANFFYHLFFLSNFDILHSLDIKGITNTSQNITWSVSVEEQFYLMWPLVFYFIPKKFWVHAIWCVVIGSISFRIIYFDRPLVLYFHTFSVLLDLGIGGLFAYSVQLLPRARVFFENCSTRMHSIFFLFCAVTVFLMYAVKNVDYWGALTRPVCALSFGLIIAAQAMTKQTSWLNLGNLQFANKWGKYTYGIYMLHPIAILLVDDMALAINFKPVSFLQHMFVAVLSFIATLVIARLSYDYYESFFLRMKHKFTAIRTRD